MTAGGSQGRIRLPNRRLQIAAAVEWDGKTWPIGMGFDAGGQVREVFADGCKTGQDMEGLLDDACILMSLLLQHGMSAAEVAESLGREGVTPGSPAASPIGAIARLAATMEREEGPAMAETSALLAAAGAKFSAEARA